MNHSVYNEIMIIHNLYQTKLYLLSQIYDAIMLYSNQNSMLSEFSIQPGMTTEPEILEKERILDLDIKNKILELNSDSHWDDIIHILYKLGLLPFKTKKDLNHLLHQHNIYIQRDMKYTWPNILKLLNSASIINLPTNKYELVQYLHNYIN